MTLSMTSSMTPKDTSFLDKEPRFRFEPSTLDPDKDLFYGCRGNLTSPDILIIGECWGMEESSMCLPFMGKSGQVLETLLTEARIDLADCAFTSVVNSRPPINDMSKFFVPTKLAKQLETDCIKGLYPTSSTLDALYKLQRVIHELQPRLIIGLGNYVLWALSEEDNHLFTVTNTAGIATPTGIRERRGSMYWYHCDFGDKRYPFLPTYHPTATFSTYPWRAMIRHDFTSRIPKALHSQRTWDTPEYQFHVRPSFEDVKCILDELIIKCGKRYTEIAVDIETRNGFIACIGLAWSDTSAICIPILTTLRGMKAGYWSLDEEVVITTKLRELLCHPNILLIGHNFSFDIQYIFAQMFFIPTIAEDTMIKHHTCFPGGGDSIKGTGPQGLVQKSLNHISSLYCMHHSYWKDEGKTWETSMPEEQLWRYNCLDCCKTWEVNQHLDYVVDAEDQHHTYRFQIDQLNQAAIPMMLRGVKINLHRRNSMQMELMTAIAQFEQKLGPLVPSSMMPELKGKQSPWYKSPKQLLHIFHEELGIKPVISRTTGKPTTDKAALPILAKREPIIKPIVDAIETLRSLNVFYGNFLTAQLDNDSRMRCSFNVAGTETFRWSSSRSAFDKGTNLQNIPSGDDASKEEELMRTRGVVFPNVRELFMPDTGYLICDADLSGADAQVVAWETQEEEWKDLLKAGTKLHSYISIEREGTDAQPLYDMYKRRIHATNYGGKPNTLYSTLLGLYGPKHTSLQLEQDFQDYWFERFPGVADWHKRIQESLQVTGGVSNKFGNRVRFQDRPSDCFTKALAWIPQSTVALVCMRGALELTKNFPFAELLLQVHDSIVFQIPISKRSKLGEIQECLNAIKVPYADPLRIPWGIKISSKSWGEVRSMGRA